MDTELALKLSKIVHDECENVPHDIGITLAECVKEHQTRRFNDVDEFYKD